MSAIDPSLAAVVRTIRFVVFDFDGVFTDNTVLVSEDGHELVRCWRGDGIGLRQLDRIGVGYAIVSTEANPVVLARSKKLNIDCTHGCNDKLSAIDSICQQRSLTRDQLAFMGNDINDRDCLRVVGLPIVVADAHEDVIPLARLRTRALGGRGAVREVCDLFARVQT